MELSQIGSRLQSNSALVIFGIVALGWILSAIWVAKDAASRSDSVWTMLLALFFVIVFTPFVGIPLWLLVRPLPLKEQKIFEAVMSEKIICHECGGITSLYDYCRACGTKLTLPCKECKNTIALQDDYCGQCGAPNLR